MQELSDCLFNKGGNKMNEFRKAIMLSIGLFFSNKKIKQKKIKSADCFVSKYYRGKVNGAVKEMNGSIFLNDDIHHAWFLFQEILNCAKKNKYPIRIISSKLYKDFYESLYNDVKSALDAGCSFEVCVTTCNRESLYEEDNKFAKLLEDHERGSIYYYNNNGKDMNSVFQMILVGQGGEIFWVNTDDKRKNSIDSSVKALVAFGKTKHPDDLGSTLLCYFKKAKANLSGCSAN